MLEMKDNGTVGYGTSLANNPFDYLDGEWASSVDFQRNTVRVWGLLQLPWGFNTSLTYFYGSGNRFAATIPVAVYGKPGTNRLNLTAAGGPTGTITIPATATLANGDVIDIASRFDGPTTIASGAVIPRDALQGLPLHKVDLRITQDIKIAGSTKVSLIAEVYNLFNHHNYGSYNTSMSATSAAVTSVFGSPQQNTGNAYVPRTGQLAFRIAF
jgi:hypothetical protein